jgi:predicted short-subunit dehydrogenase-like oxidoreductase (DUF2520 family)
MQMQLEIVMIGSGNLATHLSKTLLNCGHRIVQVFSRDANNAILLADSLICGAISNLDFLETKADLYIIAVSDHAIGQIIEKFDFSGKRVVHTAGSVPLSVFGESIIDCGVFYPLQTFSKNREIDFSRIPLCIEAKNENFKVFLNKLAGQMSNSVWQLDSDARQLVHLSGVFANNFVNHLYSIARELLSDKNIPFDILHELIMETAEKAVMLGPETAQTGPAIRNDLLIQKRHLDLLSSRPEFQHIYQWFTNDISQKFR